MRLSRHWLWLLWIPLVLLGLSRLRLDTEVLNLLPPDLNAVQGLKLCERYFADARELIITIRCPDPAQAENAARILAGRLLQETNLVTGVAWQPPWLEHPEQIGELLGWMRLNESPRTFGALTNRLSPENLKAVLTETRETLATSLSPTELARRAFDPYDLVKLPEGNGAGGLSFENPQSGFASSDGTFRILFVEAAVDLRGYQDCNSWLQLVQAIARELCDSGAIKEGTVIRYTGRPAFVSEIASRTEKDMRGSVIGTAIIIGFLFWLAHRRWLPVLWLLTLLGFVLIGTLALGGLLLGTVNIVSMGFAAILLGLAVDYAVVHYQEALAHPQASVPEIRRAIAPSILWAAVTTISAFVVLNLGGLPGLAELGSLVAIGMSLSALVMVLAYLPPLFPNRRRSSAERSVAHQVVHSREELDTVRCPKLYIGIPLLLVAVAGLLIFLYPPQMDRTAKALRPLHVQAQAALEEMQSALGIAAEPLWVLVSGKNEAEVGQRLRETEGLLERARSNQAIQGFVLPAMLWPSPENQSSNRAAAKLLGQGWPLLRETALSEGFSADSLVLTEQMFRTFAQAGQASGVLWPTNATSQWVLKRFVAHATNEWLALGLIHTKTNRVAPEVLAEAADANTRITGWQLLGPAVLERVQRDLWRVVLPMVFLVLISLWLAFRCLTEVVLSLLVLLLSGVALLALMALAGWSWNVLNLMALPLILGTGVDYSLFMQLALRRHNGNLAEVRRSVGRALLLCGATAVAGFGSLAWSGNTGMASFGKVCAAGVAANMLISVYLLPVWWKAARAKLPMQK